MLDKHMAESKKALKLAAELSREYYGKKLIIAYSGGKDSDVMLHLAEECLAPEDFEVMNSHTSVDAPPTVRHIRETKKRLAQKGIDMTIRYPADADGKQLNMIKLIVANKNPPRRNARYCCRYLKETATPNRFVALGVRGGESTNRQGRDIFATRGIEGGVSRLAAADFFR